LESVLGRSNDLLAAIGAVAGVHVSDGAEIHSYGVLGLLGAPAEQVEEVLSGVSSLDANLRAYVARRVAVLSTGIEVQDGRVHDTNFETIREIAEPRGYTVTFGGVAGDEDQAIAGRVRRLIEDGNGLVITTGGVGAEDKDRTIEALQLVVPNLATAVLASYEVGHGRHVKPDVRVAAGELEGVRVVALPGPTREVRAAMPAALDALSAGGSPANVAEAAAASIRALWRNHHRVDDHRGDDSPHGGVGDASLESDPR